MAQFSIVCLHIYDDCLLQYRKVLERGRFYFFNNWYELKEGKVVRRENAEFERGFFGSSISIQAIVGKNGSGKSSILDLLYRIINNLSYVAVETKYRATAERLYFIRGIHAEFYYELNGTLGRVICEGDSVTFKYGKEVDVNLHFASEPEKDKNAVNYIDKRLNRYSKAIDVNDRVQDIFENFFYSLAINYSMQSLNPQDYWNELACGDDKNDTPEHSWLDAIYDKNDGYLVPFGIEPYKGRNRIDLAVQKELSDSRVSVMFIDSYNRSKLQKKSIEFLSGYQLDNIYFNLRNTRPDKNDDDAVAEYNFLNKVVSEPATSRCSVFTEGYCIPIPVDIPDTNEMFRELMVYIIDKTFNIIENYPNFELFTGVRDVFFDEEEEDLTGEYDTLLRSAIEIIMNDTSHISFKIKQAVNLAKALQFKEDVGHFLKNTFNYFEFIEFFYDKDEMGFSNPVDILEHYPPSIFEQEIYLRKEGTRNEEGFKYTSLSSGERQFALTAATYLYHIRNIISVPENDEARIPYRNINLFLDEIELCYHPEYQRRFIQNIIKSLNDNDVTNDCNINILLTTHSPFVLSDIPKSNILFLKDGKVANDEITFNTFGANINDLLHKSFFLEEGFSGSLAQERINTLAKLLSDETANGEIDLGYIHKTIDIVGDPLIKHQLHLLYDAYLHRFNLEEKQQRIAELREELRQLEQE